MDLLLRLLHKQERPGRDGTGRCFGRSAGINRNRSRTRVPSRENPACRLRWFVPSVHRPGPPIVRVAEGNPDNRPYACPRAGSRVSFEIAGGLQSRFRLNTQFNEI